MRRGGAEADREGRDGAGWEVQVGLVPSPFQPSDKVGCR